MTSERSESAIEAARGAALEQVDRSARRVQWAIAAGAVLEASFLAAYLLLADFGDRTHILLLIATVAIYGIIACGLLALGAHAASGSRRVLVALDLLRRELAGRR